MKGRRACLCCVVTLCVLVVCAPQASAAVGPPTIDATSVVATGEHSAWIGASINPHGEAGYYEIEVFWQEPSPPSHGEWFAENRLTSSVQTLPAGTSDVTVSREYTTLTAGYGYWYQVYACNRTGATEGTSPYWFGFQSSAHEHWQGIIGYDPVPPCYVFYSAGEVAEEVIREQRERAEAALRKQHEEEAAQASKKVTPRAVVCIVPALKGDTLGVARRALARHHCRVGRVRSPRHHHGSLVVIGQNPKRGKRLKGGVSVALTLGSPSLLGAKRPVPHWNANAA